ncbi:MAG TPA: type VI secretion system tip protein VgrG [Candidatus Angelobacter sp.]
MSTPPSPLLAAGSRVAFAITVNGAAVPSTYQVYSIDTWVSACRVPKAQIVLFDGSPSKQDFAISAAGAFDPGKKVQIEAGYDDGKKTVIFSGIIVKQGLEINRTEGSKLVVDVADECIRMTLERKNAIFEKITDSKLILQLISAYKLAKDVASTNTEHEEIVQYYAADWDLMLMRAEMNGLLVIADGGKLTVKPPDTRQAPVLRVEYGNSILDMQAEMDASTQYADSAVKSYTWDAGSQQLVESGPGTVSVREPGKLSSAQLAKVFNVKKLPQQTGAPVEKTALKDWSSAELLRSKLSKIQGYVRFQGNALAKAGKTIELGGLGDRFNGVALISGVHHRIVEGVWLTTTEFGLSSQWFADQALQIQAPEASGQLPAIRGLQTGVVKQVAKDPGGEFRVLVNLPLLQDKSKGVWARLATFYASNKVGAVFYPEPKDEVIVGFMNEDPRYPVILGSVYSKKLAPKYPPDEKNTKKAITTLGKLEIYFDDQDKIIEIRTPGKHTIKMDDKSGAISIKDSNKNTFSLSKGGIALDSGSNIKITAKGNITVEAGANLNMTAKAKASMAGLQVAHKAKTKFSAQGTAAAELTATGMLTVRGLPVKIN